MPLLRSTGLAAALRPAGQRPITLRSSVASQRSFASKDDSKRPQPKILNTSPPKDEDASEEVKQHNREVSQRADRAHEQVDENPADKDKVSKKYWSGGSGGAEQS